MSLCCGSGGHVARACLLFPRRGQFESSWHRWWGKKTPLIKIGWELSKMQLFWINDIKPLTGCRNMHTRWSSFFFFSFCRATWRRLWMSSSDGTGSGNLLQTLSTAIFVLSFLIKTHKQWTHLFYYSLSCDFRSLRSCFLLDHRLASLSFIESTSSSNEGFTPLNPRSAPPVVFSLRWYASPLLPLCLCSASYWLLASRSGVSHLWYGSWDQSHDSATGSKGNEMELLTVCCLLVCV